MFPTKGPCWTGTKASSQVGLVHIAVSGSPDTYATSSAPNSWNNCTVVINNNQLHLPVSSVLVQQYPSHQRPTVQVKYIDWYGVLLLHLVIMAVKKPVKYV